MPNRIRIAYTCLIVEIEAAAKRCQLELPGLAGVEVRLPTGQLGLL